MVKEMLKIKNNRVVEIEQKLKNSESEKKKLIQFIEDFNKKFDHSKKTNDEAEIQFEILRKRLQ